MKKLFSYILIVGLFFPLLGHVSAASVPVIVPPAPLTSPDQKTIVLSLKDIYTRLSLISNQTQLTINQIEATGGIGTQATIDLVNANASLAKAKTTMDKIAPDASSDTFKSAVNDTEGYLKEGRTDILTTLADLKATLPTINGSSH